MIRLRKPLQSEVFTFLSLVPAGEEYYIRGTLSAGAETLQREYFAISLIHIIYLGCVVEVKH